jgi:hypothetical protein
VSEERDPTPEQSDVMAQFVAAVVPIYEFVVEWFRAHEDLIDQILQLVDRPEFCWRCDAKEAETDVGLCASCHVDLAAS